MSAFDRRGKRPLPRAAPLAKIDHPRLTRRSLGVASPIGGFGEHMGEKTTAETTPVIPQRLEEHDFS